MMVIQRNDVRLEQKIVINKIGCHSKQLRAVSTEAALLPV
jgi:hypothetical protein